MYPTHILKTSHWRVRKLYVSLLSDFSVLSFRFTSKNVLIPSVYIFCSTNTSASVVNQTASFRSFASTHVIGSTKWLRDSLFSVFNPKRNLS